EGLLGLVASCANLDPYLYKNQALSLITGISGQNQLFRSRRSILGQAPGYSANIKNYDRTCLPCG
ncbi:MAG: hypothetical protein KZQ70_10375, partial [gamma proteobacterium symbiont of Lucinoma myriamae]|nr:hypothetical protein [gamma proteobacterium symbiont of Lucinoma myriamae]MCU7832854.1 hypothetical protein [gamma proteobacterium symbiont of Lucinoma myriamae]